MNRPKFEKKINKYLRDRNIPVYSRVYSADYSPYGELRISHGSTAKGLRKLMAVLPGLVKRLKKTARASGYYKFHFYLPPCPAADEKIKISI